MNKFIVIGVSSAAVVSYMAYKIYKSFFLKTDPPPENGTSSRQIDQTDIQSVSDDNPIKDVLVLSQSEKRDDEISKTIMKWLSDDNIESVSEDALAIRENLSGCESDDTLAVSAISQSEIDSKNDEINIPNEEWEDLSTYTKTNSPDLLVVG